MAMNAAWSSTQMWRLAELIKTPARSVDASQATHAKSVQDRLTREYNRLERTRKTLVREARLVSVDGTQDVRDALMQRIIRYYADLGRLEREIDAEFTES